MQDIEGMMSISVEASEARESLSDDKELINTYEANQDPSCLILVVIYLLFLCLASVIVTEINGSRWQAQICISSCCIPQRRGWKNKVSIHLFNCLAFIRKRVMVVSHQRHLVIVKCCS